MTAKGFTLTSSTSVNWISQQQSSNGI